MPRLLSATVAAALCLPAPAIAFDNVQIRYCIPEVVIDKHNPDPIIRTEINITSRGFRVAHHSHRGITYLRNQQYIMDNFNVASRKDQLGNTYYWSGHLRKDPSIVMVGKLDLEEDPKCDCMQFHYLETLVDKNKSPTTDHPEIVTNCWAGID